jgi:heme ABC exporter ATP-binding subunit CcmA
VPPVPYALELSQLCKTYGRARAVDAVSCRVDSGAAVALLGPNGAGKTTLLKLCSTLLRPTSGSLRLAGFDAVDQGSEVRRRVALLGHDAYLYPDLTAVENLSFYARLYGVADAARRIDEVAERLALRGFAHRPVRTFSRGMLQRCALARVLLQQPDVLLLDEPFTGLDLEARANLSAALERLHRDGTTLVMTTHDLDEALRLCTSALVLRSGRLLWQGELAGVASFDLRAHYSALLTTTATDRAS